MADSVDYLIESLANSATAQTFVGATGPDLVLSAKAKIFFEAVPGDMREKVPFIIVHDQGGTFERSAHDDFSGGGELMFELWEQPSAGIIDNLRARSARMREVLLAIATEIFAQALTSGRLCDIRRIRYDGAQHRETEDIESKGDHSMIRAFVQWSQGSEG